MNTAPATFDELIATWGIQRLADDFGVNYSTVNAMKQRNSIPSRWWPILLDKARARGVKVSQRSLYAIQQNSNEARAAKRQSEAA